MSRGKRERKSRAIRRRIKKAEKFKRYAAEATEALEAHREGARIRAAINASDAPEAAKRVFGFFIDPHGFIFDELQKRAATETKGDP